jgi:hypothetical protein
MKKKKPVLKMHKPAKAPKVHNPSPKENFMKESDNEPISKRSKSPQFPMKQKRLSK